MKPEEEAISERAPTAYSIRAMREEDIPEVVEITKAHTFLYPVSSLRSFMEYDPDGILVAVGEAGTVLGVCCCVRNSENLFFGGIFCVREEYRTLGLGHELFAQCYSHAKSTNIGCNCTSDKLNSYKRRGFGILETAWSTLEYETKDTVDPSVLSDDLPLEVALVPYRDAHFRSVAAYDRALVGGLDRTDILDLSFHEDDSYSLVAFNGDRACVGFGSIKLGIQGSGQVGPLYADDPRVAEAMLRRLIEGFAAGRGLAMVTVSSNLHAIRFLDKLRVKLDQKTFRVYTKQSLRIDTDRVYAQFDADFAAI